MTFKIKPRHRFLFGLVLWCLSVTSASAFTCTESTNVALAANGATATASSAFSGFGATGAINGDRKGLYFLNPSSRWARQERAIILLHEAVHQVGKKGDSAFGGSKSLSEKIIKGCFPVLAGKLGGVG